MKNLSKIPRISSAKFCLLETISSDYESNELIINSLKELTQEVESTPESTEYSDKKIIDSAINSAKNGEKLPESFKKIKASEFLKRSPEELKTLFIVDGIVDFRGNNFAKREIGLVDLFPKISDKQQFVVLDGISYAYGARRQSDRKIGYGNPKYKSITGGENIEYFIGETTSQSFIKNTEKDKTIPKYDNFAGFSADYLSSMENLTPDEEKTTKENFIKNVKSREKWQTYSLSIESGLDDLSLSEKKGKALSFFKDNGYTAEQSAGIVGNLIIESNLNTFAVGDGGKAFGIAQWHPDRQANFSRVFGKNIHNSTFEEQLSFVKWELENTEKTANNHLKSTTTTSEAAYAFDKHFERSDGSARGKRIIEAQKINNQYDNIA